MRHLVFILCLALSLSSCAHFENAESQGGMNLSNELPFAAEIPLARGLDANGDGAITPQDAEWFSKLSDALVDAEKVGYIALCWSSGTPKGLGNCRLWAACAAGRRARDSFS